MVALSAAFLLLISFSAGCHGARILAAIPFPSISHQLPFRTIALELVKRGHQVTLITTDPIKESIDNYTEIDVSHTYKYWKSTFDFTSVHDYTPTDVLKLFSPVMQMICETQFDSPQIQAFLQSDSSFDVMILERFTYGCYYGMAHKFGSPPLVGFTSLGLPSLAHWTFANPFNPAYNPDFMIPYTDHMSFWQRLYNTYLYLFSLRMLYSHRIAEHDAIQQKYFGPNMPSVYETETNFSLLLVNNHFSMSYPRPNLPNVVELTGLHLQKDRKPLPQKIKQFLDGAKDGVIYFSLGSNVVGSAMPEDKRRAFLEAFSSLPQRVLWKWEADSLPGQPDNVMAAKWLPQQDVLAHPNVRLFITQGGLQSFNEAVYNAVPLIGIPFMGDQAHNVAKMEEAGIGYKLIFKDVTMQTVLKAISTVLEDARYRENMRRLSLVFREHQEQSLDKAVWWIEYVIRHNGARHLRSAALDLRWWQLLLLDVAAFLLAVAAAASYLLYRLAQWLLAMLGRQQQKVKKS